MKQRQMRWPEGTGQFRRMHTVVVSNDAEHRVLLAACAHPDTTVVATPLDVISRLEADAPIGRVVLVGSAAESELALFLREFYPALDIVDGNDDDRYLPALA